MQEYRYSEHTPIRHGCIRLLKLLPGHRGTDLEANLEIRWIRQSRGSLDENAVKDPEPYEALSYHRGHKDNATKFIKILAWSQSYFIRIKTNLDCALRHLRDEREPRFFWVDALCINQADDDEKTVQILQMSLIYSRAKSVAMRRPWFNRRWIIQEIALAKEATRYCGEDVSWRDFADVISLFAYKKYELRQLFRESAAHRNHPDYLGDLSELGAVRLVFASDNLFRKSEQGKIMEHLFSLEAVMSSMSAFEASDPHDILYAVLWLANDAHPVAKNATQVMGLRPRNPPPSAVTSPTGSPTQASRNRKDSISDQNGTAESAGPSRLVTNGEKPLQRPVTFQDDVESKPQHLIPERMVEHRVHMRRLSTQGHDSDISKKKIATQMLMNSLKNRRIIVDYKKDVFQVCKDFLEFTVRKSRSLDMICRPWAPDDCHLPSWAPPLSKGAFSPGVKRVHRRVNADPLVGEPGIGSKLYRASSSLQADWSPKADHERALNVKGFVLDSVFEKKSPAAAGIVPSEWMAAGGWDDVSTLPPDSFWRTLVGNRNAYGQRPPSHWRRVCRDAFTRKPARGDLNTSEIIMYDCPSAVREFLERVQCMVWSRRLVVLTNMPNALALVPINTKKGDLICILYGCSVPVVLRKYIGGVPATKQRTRCQHPDCPTNIPHRHHRDVVIHAQNGDTTVLKNGKVVDEYYEFVGEAYVHGMMDGEAFHVKREKKLVVESFELR
ncbi:hypothetical protein M409DRAFT_60751 [Zasmidium cellare ATCC 36951]|uniref:Heterokaryon incompatibility domain-containing protein n=1 Tax=Zasmidium cellare ATCC 36951 TaxID=1080233 RepID=A0A6A6C145_ZASCE|nr:uncharacterized protein M409DRAFT_60751 [Zasmidium cellare ATCC 36951]KAF2159539.1 hypothetical protein M409DRAFT_60751 [Zasmidium cellare ATCC 36951]